MSGERSASSRSAPSSGRSIGLLRGTEIAEAVGSALKKTVEYVNIPIETWREALVNVAGFSEYLATHLAAVAQDHQDGIFSAETCVVREIGGQEPQSVEDFVLANRAQFGPEVALTR